MLPPNWGSFRHDLQANQLDREEFAMRRVKSRAHRSWAMETLEPRHLLAAVSGEGLPASGAAEGLLDPIVEFKLDVRQNGQSLLDQNRNFNVDVGERFDLEVLYSDLRSPEARLGVSGFAANVLSSMPAAFRPVVTERQFFDFSDELDNATGGSVVIGLEGSSNTVSVDFATIFADAESAFATAAEQVMGLPSGTVQTEFFTNPFFVAFDFKDESLAFSDIPNLTIDTSGLTGASVSSASREEPVFIDGDPSSGINPATFRTSLDFSSRSLNDLTFYRTFAGGGLYDPSGPVVFRELLASGFVLSSFNVASFAEANSIPFDGTDFEAMSIRVEAVQEASGVDFTIAPIDRAEGDYVFIYGDFDPVMFDQLLFDLEDDPSVPGDDRFALVTGNFGAAALPPFQNPDNRFDVDRDNEVGVRDVLALINEINGRIISMPDGTLPDPPPDPIVLYIDVNGDNLFTQADVDDLFEEIGQIDFGDAPTPHNLALQRAIQLCAPTTGRGTFAANYFWERDSAMRPMVSPMPMPISTVSMTGSCSCLRFRQPVPRACWRSPLASPARSTPGSISTATVIGVIWANRFSMTWTSPQVQPPIHLWWRNPFLQVQLLPGSV